MRVLCELPSAGQVLGDTLGIALDLAVATRPAPLACLGDGERRLLAVCAGPARRREWLTGRAALKRLLRRHGASVDTARLHLPAAHISLTHAAGMALAAGVAQPVGRGLGVDLEQRRALPAAAARFFLDPCELRAVAAPGVNLLSLWCVKESLYKAWPGNPGGALRDLVLCGRPLAGRLAAGAWLLRGAATAPSGQQLRYACFHGPTACLAVAVCDHGLLTGPEDL